MALNRRNFIKNSALGSLGALSSINSTFAKSLFENLLNFDSSQKPILIDLIRQSDLLHLKIHLYNVKLKNKRKLIAEKGFYMFVQLPSQHIAEELITSLADKDGQLKNRKKSFLSGSSWLVLKNVENKKRFKINESYILDWKNNFELVTLDHLKNSKGQLSSLNLKEKRELLCNIKEHFQGNEEKLKNLPLSYKNENDEIQYFSTFEVPYKMFLSPISEPKQGYKFERQIGKFSFSSNINLNLLEHSKKGSSFYSLNNIWENQLKFQSINGNSYPPRFKIVDYESQKAIDNDVKHEDESHIKLLPYPSHRKELNELTMLPYSKRDVVSNFFKISALGTSTKLKYKNEQPIENTTIVSWEQHIKYARDNYVSVTLRAIDVFTGLKLLISTVAERKFKEGKSFLLLRYYISYLEFEKELINSQIIGKTSFVKIKALTKGAYFTPVKLGDSTYHVQKEDLNKFCNKNISSDFKLKNDLEFKYIGVDKKGKEHIFYSKIIFISAESYNIKSGEYVFKCDENTEFKYDTNSNKDIDIRHIGNLNPNCQLIKGKPNSKCDNKYTYEITRNFNSKNNIQKLLKVVRSKINDPNLNLIDHYSIKIDNEITYADITTLQTEFEGKYLVNPKSNNASFKTRNIFLFSEAPEKIVIEKVPEDYNELDCDENDISLDPFSAKYPLIPFLHHAEVVIPQISQIEGKDVYRNVALTKSFWERKDNSSFNDFDIKSQNKYHLLFKLINLKKGLHENPLSIENEPLKGFFSNNYRNSGGAVNPGITISHISVLDNGITYSESHNEKYKNRLEESAKKGGNVSIESSIETNTVFEALEAEIFGINLLDIVGKVLGIDELPAFNFIKDADKAFNNVKDKYESLKSIYDKWTVEYENLESEIKKIKDDISKSKSLINDNISNDFKKAKKELKGQINNILRQNDLLSKYESGLEQVYNIIHETDKLEEIGNNLKEKFIKRLDENLLKNFNKNLDEIKFTDYYPVFPTSDEKEKLEKKLILFKNNIKDLLKSFKPEKELINFFSSYIFYRFLYVIRKSNDIIKNSNEEEKKLIEKKYNSKLVYELFLDELRELKKEIAIESNEETKTLSDVWNKNYLAFIRGVEKASKYFKKLNLTNYKRLENEVSLKTEKTLDKYSTILQKTLEKNSAEIDIYFENVKKIDVYFKKYEFYKNYYDSLKTDFLINNNQLNKISDDLKGALLSDLDKILKEVDDKVKPKIIIIKKTIEKEKTNIFQKLDQSDFSEKYKSEVNKTFNKITTGILAYYKFEQQINLELEKLKINLENEKNILKDKEEQIKGFFDRKKKELDNEYQKQIKILQNDPRNLKVQKFVKEIREFKEKLQEATTQKLNYQFKTKNFNNVDLGIISFVPTKDTELSVNVNYSLEFNIPSLGASPVLSKQSFLTDTTFVDFQIGFLKLIYVDFEKIRFISGSDVKDDFQVKIRDVQFAGCLSFVSAIQEYLNGISNNLIFEVNSSGAMVNYILPPFTIDAAPFKLFNISFSALLTLPFDPNKSLQLQFGLGSPLNKFGLIYLAFGGQGYFNIIVEPKQGIVGLVVVLEFGAIYQADIGGVAKGVAYLVGGIYIKRYYGNYQIKAYILCVGRFSILGIFSASASFYLGLEGDGNRLDGVCIITFKKRFSSFFTLKVKARMKKTIYGAKEKSDSEEQLKQTLRNYKLEYIHSNIFEERLKGEKIYISASTAKDLKFNEHLLKDFKLVKSEQKKSNSEVITYEYDKPLKDFKLSSIIVGDKEVSCKKSEKEFIVEDKKQRDIEYFKSIF